MAVEIEAPNYPSSANQEFSIFLGGSIEMGSAKNWQKDIINLLSGYKDELVIYNPRRSNWDSSWAQDPTHGSKFSEQVLWEMEHQESADLLIYYFDANTKSPITLLELGAYGTAFSTIVFCEKEFYRYGNVKLFCERYGIPHYETYEDFSKGLLEILTERIT